MSVSVDKSMVPKIEALVAGGSYRNKSHVVEFALNQLLEGRDDEVNH